MSPRKRVLICAATPELAKEWGLVLDLWGYAVTTAPVTHDEAMAFDAVLGVNLAAEQAFALLCAFPKSAIAMFGADRTEVREEVRRAVRERRPICRERLAA